MKTKNDYKGLSQVPPCNITFESLILSSILNSQNQENVIQEVLKIFNGNHKKVFYNELHQKIFNIMLNLQSENLPIDDLFILLKLEEDKKIDRYRANETLEIIKDLPGNDTNIKYWADYIFKDFKLREIIQNTYKLYNEANDPLADPDYLLERINGLITKYQTPTKEDRKVESALTFLKREKTRTPYIIDKIIPESGFTSIAGYTGHGKSSLAMQMILCILSGLPFLNQFEIKNTDCHILYINLENSEFTIDSLLNSQLKEFNVSDDKLANNLFIPDCMAMSFDNRQDVIRIKKWIEELHIEIIIVDPILDSFTGDQNDLMVIRALIKKLREINGKLSWILLQHFNKGDNDQELIKLMLGSIGFANAMTSIIGLRRYARNDDPKIKKIEFGKTRDYERPEDIKVVMNHNRVFEVCGHTKDMPKADPTDKVVTILKEHGNSTYNELVGKIGLLYGYSDSWSKKLVTNCLIAHKIMKSDNGIYSVKKQLFKSYIQEFK